MSELNSHRWSGDYESLSQPFAHPGVHLRLEYMPGFKMDAESLSAALGLDDPSSVNELLDGKAAVTPDLASRLAKIFGTSAEFWMNLQSQHSRSLSAVGAKAKS